MKKLIFLAGLILLACNSCVTIQTGEDIAYYIDDINHLNNKLSDNEKDFDALRELAIIYVKTNHNKEAEEYIDRALSLQPTDPSMLFYNGLNKEMLHMYGDALDSYKKFEEVSILSPYRKLMSGRFTWLSREMVYEDVRLRITNEQLQLAVNVSESTLAVFPLEYLGDNKKYTPLSRGLSEMISMDLAKVKKIKVLERIRLKALQDELAFGQSIHVDQNSAPRMGKLLRAGRVLAGSYNIYNDNNIFVDLGSWKVETGRRDAGVERKGELPFLFQIEKEVVFNLIDNLGIQLTPEEKEQIQIIPTENLEAFLSYCKGLESEDAGEYDKAASFFREAMTLDPEFSIADTKAGNTENLDLASGSTDRILGVASVSDPTISIVPPPSDALVIDRLGNLQDGLQIIVVPGVDNRTPTQSGPIVEQVSELPEPPPPPNRK